MILRLDMIGDVPIYLQLRNQIVLGIGTGKLKNGQSLPTVRQLAEDVGINVMTVAKAYTFLKNEGFIEIDRRHGAKINLSRDVGKVFQKRLENELALLIAESMARGMDSTAFVAVCEKLFKNMKPIGGA